VTPKDAADTADAADTVARLQRIEQFIAEHREAKRRQFLRRAIKLWRKAEAQRWIAKLDVPPDRVH
jgi:hypothetical protein